MGYRWDWTNDGIWDTGWLTEPTTAHAYSGEFHGRVELEVMDDGGVLGACFAHVDVSHPGDTDGDGVSDLDDDHKPIKNYYLGDPEKVKAAMDAVAAQGKKKN